MPETTPDTNQQQNSEPVVTLNGKEFNLNDSVETFQEAEFRVEQTKNTAKRHMAWVSLGVVVAILLGCFVVYFVKTIDIERFAAVKGTLETGMWGLVSIVGFYFGFAAFSNSKWAQSGDQQSH